MPVYHQRQFGVKKNQHPVGSGRVFVTSHRTVRDILLARIEQARADLNTFIAKQSIASAPAMMLLRGVRHAEMAFDHAMAGGAR